MAASAPWPCRFHSAASPGEAIVKGRCPSDIDSRFHGRGTNGLPLSASLVGHTVSIPASSVSSEAYTFLYQHTDHRLDGSAFTTLSTGIKGRCDDPAVSHIETPTGGQWLVPFQLARPTNGDSSDLIYFLGWPEHRSKMDLQGHRSNSSNERYKMRDSEEDFTLFADKDQTIRAVGTHLSLQPLQQGPTDLPLEPSVETRVDWLPLQPSRLQPPPTPRITQLPDPDLDDVEESDSFPSLDDLDQQRQGQQNRHRDGSCQSR